jgi:hypothetical protein
LAVDEPFEKLSLAHLFSSNSGSSQLTAIHCSKKKVEEVANLLSEFYVPVLVVAVLKAHVSVTRLGKEGLNKLWLIS